MKKLLLGLALVGLAFGCRTATTSEVTDTSELALTCTEDCDLDCAQVCEESGKEYCSKAHAASAAECAGKSECSASASCDSESECPVAASECKASEGGKVCPVTGQQID